MNKLFAFLIPFLVSVSAFSQQYNFINYSIEEGLVQSQIRAIHQDDAGYIWIGTLGGLSKFDGINFENFSTNDGLLSNQINSIFNDSKGNVWFGGQGGVSVYDGKSFKQYQFKEALNQYFIFSIAEDKHGRMWFACEGGGVVYLQGGQFNYVVLPNGTYNNYVRSIAIDEQDNKWLATRNGLSIIDSNLIIKDTISNVNASQVFIDADKTVWCSTYGDGVLQLVNDTCIKLTIDSGLLTNHIRGFTKRKDGSFWFVSKDGVSKYQEGVFKNFTSKDGLTQNNIKCVIEDKEGNLFFGSDGGGLIKFTNEDFISYSEQDDIGSNVVMSVLEDSSNNMWISTYDAGITKIEKDSYTHYQDIGGTASNTVWCSLLAKDNRIWFGTSFGLYVYNGVIFKAYQVKDGLSAKKVYALNEDENGNIWIGTKDGVSLLDVEKDSIHDYTQIIGLRRNIRFIFSENPDVKWYCSSEGLSRYDMKSGRADVFTVENGLPDNSVMTLVKDKANRLWIGTQNGLAIYYQGEIKALPLPDNYASNNVNFLELDENENLWIGTNFGLYQLNTLNKDTFFTSDFIRYSNLDGLKSSETNQNASFIDSENNLWFGTSYGLMKHKLGSQNKSSFLPKVQIKDIRLFFEKKDLTKYSKGDDLVTGLPNDFIVPYNKSHLTFDFVGIYHTSPDKVKYRFKLDGFDENWQPVTRSTFVTYSNIPSGDFTFQLSATTDLKNWTRPVAFSFTVKPPFWFTWWFYLVCLIVVSALIWLIVNKQINKNELKRSTQLIIDRSKMLELEQQALNSSMNRHFIFNALNSIQYYINRQDKIAANKYLSSFAKLVRKNLDSSLVNEIFLDDEIERIELYLKLEEMRFQDKFVYQVNVGPEIESQSVKIPSMLLQPFIENSIWHGILTSDKKGSITIDISKREDKLIIKIVDDGIGIDVSRANKKGKKQHHDSKGMDLTKGRIDLISKVSKKECAIKGPFQIYNKKREIAGTEVSIIIAL